MDKIRFSRVMRIMGAGPACQADCGVDCDVVSHKNLSQPVVVVWVRVSDSGKREIKRDTGDVVSR